MNHSVESKDVLQARSPTLKTGDSLRVSYFDPQIEVEYHISCRPTGKAADPELADFTITELVVQSAYTVEAAEVSLVGYLLSSDNPEDDIDLFFQAAGYVNDDLADAVASLRGWEPGIAGEANIGPLLVLLALNDDRGDTVARGAMAAFAKASDDYPEFISAKRLISAHDAGVPFGCESIQDEMTRLTTVLGIQPARFVPWQPATQRIFSTF